MVAFALAGEPVGMDENAQSPQTAASIPALRPPDATGLLGLIVVDDAHQVYAPSNYPYANPLPTTPP